MSQPVTVRHARASDRPAPQRWHADDVLSVIAAGAIFVLFWPLLLAVRAAQPVRVDVVTAHATGMLAGYGVAVLVGLMSRVPGLERGVGADRLARWHSRGGRIVVLLVLIHAGAATTAWAASRHEGIALSVWHVLRCRA